MRAQYFIASLLWAAGAAAGLAQPRLNFEIAVGPVTGDLYVQGERLAGVVSHPPGLSRCTDAALCAPEGVIATARATAGVSEGLLAIARGEIASAFSPADVAAAMRLSAGKGKQNQSRLRAIGIVGEETVYLIAASKGPVTSLRGLRGRWVGIGGRGSRTRVAANALLAAAKIDQDRIKASDTTAAAALDLVKKKKLDAFVWVGVKLPSDIAAALQAGSARIVPLDKTALVRLTAAGLGYAIKRIANGETASVPIVWLADEKQPSDVVYGVVRAAFNVRNKPMLSPAEGDSSSVVLSRPLPDLPLPLHAGAIRYFAANTKPSN